MFVTLKRITALTCLLAVFGCQDDADITDYDEAVARADGSVDFTKYTTFGFLEDIDAENLNVGDAPEFVSVNNITLKTKIREERTVRGLTETTTDPDLWIAALFATENEAAIIYDCVEEWYWWGYWGGYDSCAYVDADLVQYQVGTLLIPFADREEEALVFVGAMQGIVDSSVDTEERLCDGIETIFRSYPVPRPMIP